MNEIEDQVALFEPVAQYLEDSQHVGKIEFRVAIEVRTTSGHVMKRAAPLAKNIPADCVALVSGHMLSLLLKDVEGVLGKQRQASEFEVRSDKRRP